MSGIRSQLGLAKEVAYGTFVVPDEWLIFDSETLSRVQTYLTSMGLGSGALVPRASLHRETVRGGEGTISGKVPNLGFGKILDLLHNLAVVPVQQGATAAYLQEHEIGESAPRKSASIQVGKPTIDTVEPFTALGCVPTSIEFACDMGGELTFSLAVDARDLVTTEALAVNNPPADWSPRDFTEGEILLGGVAPGVLIKRFTLTIPLPRKTDRHGLGSNGLKAYPVVNDYIRPTMSLTAEFTDMEMHDHYTNEDELPIAVRFEGPDIAAGEPEMIEFDLGVGKVVGSTPGVSGPDVLETEAPIEIYSDGAGTAPVIVRYQSEEAAL